MLYITSRLILEISNSTIHKSKPGSDQTDHVTVEYKKADGSHVTTRHVPVVSHNFSTVSIL